MEYSGEKDIYEEIKFMIDFYDFLSDNCENSFPEGSVINYNVFYFYSIKNTLDSISVLLKLGRINDAYVLVRKFFDDVITNTYLCVKCKDDYDFDNNFIVKDVFTWVKTKFRIPILPKLLKALEGSQSSKDLYCFFKWESDLKNIRQYIDDSVHCNAYERVLFNCKSKVNDIELPKILSFLKQVFAIHLSFIFYLNPEFLVAQNIVSYLEQDEIPPDDCECWMASIAQDAFDKYIKPKAELATFIKKNCWLIIE